MNEIIEQVAVIARIAQLKPRVGRTAIMKFLYLLQAVKGQPLGYRFQLYTYGPYDAAVLSAISTAKSWGAVKETMVSVPSGYGYDIEPGPEAESIVRMATGLDDKLESDLSWVIEQFGSYSAGDLELIGTIVYADREAKEEGEWKTKAELLDTVLQIKPRFHRGYAEAIYDRVLNTGCLLAVKP